MPKVCYEMPLSNDSHPQVFHEIQMNFHLLETWLRRILSKLLVQFSRLENWFQNFQEIKNSQITT